MSVEPLVSIVIPAYNHEKYISDCLDSLLKQTYKNIEVIVLNDGSNDNTLDIIKSYEERCRNRFVKFLCIDKKNEGISKTLNRGINESVGKYITFLASDDMFIKNKVELQVKYLLSNPKIKFVWSNGYRYKNESKEKTLFYDKKPTAMKKNHKKLFEYLLIKGNIIIPSGMYEKVIFEKIGMFDEKLKYEDWDLYLRVSYEYKVGYIHIPLIIYRLHEDNISKKYKFMKQGTLQTLDKAFKNISIKNKFLKKRKAYSNAYLILANNFCDNSIENYKNCIRIAFKYNIFNPRIYKSLILKLKKVYYS